MTHIRTLQLRSLAAALTACTSLPDATPRVPLGRNGTRRCRTAATRPRCATGGRASTIRCCRSWSTRHRQTSPTLAQALARVARRAPRCAAAEAGRWPSLDGSRAGLARVECRDRLWPRSQASVGGDARWEIDLFGGVRHDIAAAQAARASAPSSAWHEARVTLAAEVAQAYIGLRACEALVACVAAGGAARSARAPS